MTTITCLQSSPAAHVPAATTAAAATPDTGFADLVAASMEAGGAQDPAAERSTDRSCAEPPADPRTGSGTAAEADASRPEGQRPSSDGGAPEPASEVATALAGVATDVAGVATGSGSGTTRSDAAPGSPTTSDVGAQHAPAGTRTPLGTSATPTGPAPDTATGPQPPTGPVVEARGVVSPLGSVTGTVRQQGVSGPGDPGATGALASSPTDPKAGSVRHDPAPPTGAVGPTAAGPGHPAAAGSSHPTAPESNPAPLAAPVGVAPLERHGAGEARPAAPGATAPPIGLLTGTGAPTAAAASGLAAPAGANPVVPQVMGEITGMMARGDGTHRIRLRLSPESLGDVAVILTARGGSVEVTLGASGHGRLALEQATAELSRLLELAGARTTQVLVKELTSTGTAFVSTGAHGQGPAQEHPQHPGRRGSAGQPDSGFLPGRTEAVVAPTEAPRPAGPHATSLDVSI